MNSIRWIHITDAICKSPMPWSYFWLIKKYSLFLWQLIKILLFKMKSFQNWIRIPQDFEEIRARGEAFALVSLCVPFYHKKNTKSLKNSHFFVTFWNLQTLRFTNTSPFPCSKIFRAEKRQILQEEAVKIGNFGWKSPSVSMVSFSLGKTSKTYFK